MAPSRTVIIVGGLRQTSYQVMRMYDDRYATSRPLMMKPGYEVTVFDKCKYNESKYNPDDALDSQAASVDHNKILRPSYGTEIHYQRLALESREEWMRINQDYGSELFVNCGMLRLQPSEEMGQLEKDTLTSMERDGLRDTQFVKSHPEDVERATTLGWKDKLLSFSIPDDTDKSFEAVLDSLSGFVKCSEGCAYIQSKAATLGVKFQFGNEEGRCDSLILEENSENNSGTGRKVIGIKTGDGVVHNSDTVVVAAGSFSSQVLPDLSYHLESSAGSLATFKIKKSESDLWQKYAPEKSPVLIWKSAPPNKNATETGSIYSFPRTEDGLIKIGFRGIKFTNFVPAPKEASFSQDGRWSVPLPSEQSQNLPAPAVDAIRQFVSIFLPEFAERPFYSTRLCWYTDTLDNSFLIDYVPTYINQSLFVCTGGSGHGAKFLPILGKHAADIFEHEAQSTSYMYPHWRWRGDKSRKNGLEEGPAGPRNMQSRGNIA